MIVRKLTKAIRYSIAQQANEEQHKQDLLQYSISMQAYVDATPQDVLDIMAKYPDLVTTYYAGEGLPRYTNYGTPPQRPPQIPTEYSELFLSLSSISTFEEVSTLFPALTKYLPE